MANLKRRRGSRWANIDQLKLHVAEVRRCGTTPAAGPSDPPIDWPGETEPTDAVEREVIEQ